MVEIEDSINFTSTSAILKSPDTSLNMDKHASYNTNNQ
jgi:hypothetical protein